MPKDFLSPTGQPIFHEVRFSEPQPSPDPLGFETDHPSDNATYARVQELLKKDVVSFERSRVADTEFLSLSSVYGDRGSDVVDKIRQSGRIVFHAVGDTGSSDSHKYRNQLRVADQLAMDCQTPETSNRPSFFLNLGDVIYNFGESQYYYDQFYEPYRSYAAPILAIPGNHDSFILPDTAPEDEPLKTFARNFCATEPMITKEAGSLHRTAMIQPGVYYTLDAPFVRIICLFSNSLEDPGLISSQGGHWTNVPDYQLDFLAAQLAKIKAEQFAGAVIIATHHPAFSYSTDTSTTGDHGGSPAMLADIDRICVQQGVYPHAFISGHVHNYQRFTRSIEWEGRQFQVPFTICGGGGHNVSPLVRGSRKNQAPEPENGSDVSYLDRGQGIAARGLRLEKYDDHEYGYLRLTVDANQLRIAFHQVGTRSILQSRFDLVTIDLQSHQIVGNS